MTAKQITVAIADDHKLFCEALRLYLVQQGFDVVGTVNGGRAAIDLVVDLEPDVLLLDVRMPDVDGLRALPAVKSASPGTYVIMLTGTPSQEHVVQSFMLGASCFLPKTCEPEHLTQAIRMAARGDAVVDRGMLQVAMRELKVEQVQASDDIEYSPPLTDQETRVLQLIATGLANDRIADVLCVSRNTIKTHTRNIYSKLGVSDRTQAAVWAMRNGLAS